MIVTITNKNNNFSINFLSRQAIVEKYGPEVAVLGVEEAIRNQDFNLFEPLDGNGGFYGLPDKTDDNYLRNFSQEYNYIAETYGLRTVTFNSNLFNVILTKNISVTDVLNRVLDGSGRPLRMTIDNTVNKGAVRVVENVSCTSSPLSNNSYQFAFNLYGDSRYTFKSKIQYEILTPNLAEKELKYPKVYPIKYLQTQSNQVKIDNPTDQNTPIGISFRNGSGTDPTVTNLTTSQTSGYKGNITDADIVNINSENLTLTKNNVNELQNLEGTFIFLAPGENILTFEYDNVDVNNIIDCYIAIQFGFTSV